MMGRQALVEYGEYGTDKCADHSYDNAGRSGNIGKVYLADADYGNGATFSCEADDGC